ncbi:MAG: hypothetical protein AAGG08_03250, partial [Actinomycetota bacterium]
MPNNARQGRTTPRRQWMALVLGATTLAACGSDAPGSASDPAGGGDASTTASEPLTDDTPTESNEAASSTAADPADDVDDVAGTEGGDDVGEPAGDASAGGVDPDGDGGATSDVGAGTAVSTDDVPMEFTFAGATGDVTVPVTSENVVALDENSTLALLTLGVTPTAVSLFQDGTMAQIIESEGIPTEVAGSLEWLAQQDPALMLGLGHPNNIGLQDEHLGIAPTGYTNFTSPWIEQQAALAGATGRSDEADRVAAWITAETESLRARLDEAGFAEATISIIQQA